LKFKIGDRVQHRDGLVGKVVCLFPDFNCVSVQFDSDGSVFTAWVGIFVVFRPTARWQEVGF
jgi:hypothetical protein